jgi:hypothetical protein
MIVALQRKLSQQLTMDQERLFFSQSLTYFSTLSGRKIQVEDWIITSYEVDFIEEIGSGGLYVLFSSLLWSVAARLIVQVFIAGRSLEVLGARWRLR